MKITEFTTTFGSEARIGISDEAFPPKVHLEIKATHEGLIVEFWDDEEGDFIPVYTATYDEMADSAGLECTL